MLNIKGLYNNAVVYTTNIEESAVSQLQMLLSLEAFKDSKIRIMPDVHTGSGCVIGFTGDLGHKVIPNIVGVDIGCGMYTVELGNIDLDLKKLDEAIYKVIPSGFEIHTEPKADMSELLNSLNCLKEISGHGWNVEKWNCQLGTLGGGNHFIEVDIDNNGNKFLVIHTGSRNLGKRIADYYQELAIWELSGKGNYEFERLEIIRTNKENGTTLNIKGELDALKIKYAALQPNFPKELCYLEGESREKYLHDMSIAQKFASLNRYVIAKELLKELGLYIESFSNFETVHNYISREDNIIRKGAISANKGERVLIPITMRDGAILAEGLGNEDWNNSAPHGAGRLMSRTAAKNSVLMEDYKNSMSGIYTTSVCEETLDEAPQAYKTLEEIVENTKDTLKILKIIKPIYNYKDKSKGLNFEQRNID